MSLTSSFPYIYIYTRTSFNDEFCTTFRISVAITPIDFVEHLTHSTKNISEDLTLPADFLWSLYIQDHDTCEEVDTRPLHYILLRVCHRGNDVSCFLLVEIFCNDTCICVSSLELCRTWLVTIIGERLHGTAVLWTRDFTVVGNSMKQECESDGMWQHYCDECFKFCWMCYNFSTLWWHDVACNTLWLESSV